MVEISEKTYQNLMRRLAILEYMVYHQVNEIRCERCNLHLVAHDDIELDEYGYIDEGSLLCGSWGCTP